MLHKWVVLLTLVPDTDQIDDEHAKSSTYVTWKGSQFLDHTSLLIALRKFTMCNNFALKHVTYVIY